MKIRRFPSNPMIRPNMDDRMGSNINGPSLIRAPDWLPNALGKYYLYFAHHQGQYIRLAYADRLEGPWSIYTPGTLHLEESFCSGHIASPDVHIDDQRKQIRMYYHGPSHGHGQVTRLALSEDGILFRCREEILGPFYFRVFEWAGFHYALVMPGTIYRSKDGLGDFKPGPTLFTPNMRHAAVKLAGQTLYVWYSNAYDCPERILFSTIDLRPDWREWRETAPVTFLESETVYEGADCPLEPSARGAVHQRVRQLRDPGIFEENGRTYLLYSVAGEHGIAFAEILDTDWSASG